MSVALEELAEAKALLVAHELDAEQTWTPGQVFGSLLQYLDRVETFADDPGRVLDVIRRTRWYARILAQSAQRAAAQGLEPSRLAAARAALERHERILLAEHDLKNTRVKAARDLIRLEIAYLQPGSA
jgi:hypothetical protein